MTALMLSADTCPICRFVHGQTYDWPTCPNDRHALKEIPGTRGQLDGLTYACLACKYTHTQREEATMTTALEATHAALAIRDGQDFWTPKQLAALRQIGADDAPEGDLQVFFHYCQATGLDPFAKQIRLRKDRQKVKDGNGERWENRWSIETEIDGYRVIAHRAAKRDGVELSYGPPVWFDGAGVEHKIWLGDEPPAGVGRTVYKDGKPFPAVIRFKSFAKYTSGGQLQALWAVMGDHLIGKCVEAQALRMAFPHDLEGIHLSEETAAAGNGAAPVTAQQVPAQPARQPLPPRRKPAQRPQAPRDGVVIKALAEAISRQFKRIGVEDPDECENWVRKLNQDAEGELTADQLRFALAALGEKNADDGSYAVPDLAALVELCDPGTPAEPAEDEIEAPF